MSGLRTLLGCALVGAALAGGCAARHPAAPLGAKDTALTDNASAYTAPLDLREFDVAQAEGGYRGVFLKLSGLPSGVSATSQDDPARIIVDIHGPTGAESPEEVFPAGDTLVTHIAVSRQLGGLRVVLDLQSDEAPEYAVYPMADWVLVRIKPANIKPRPWAHRAS